ncbi:XrtN system VIT domain-containing protein [Pontibacter sp. G13]|uniref:XrtN system VIT domain-containing protein n=1 Tax=Pontibacter sp. G13 TaxID=3074898 RepID=UPI00288B5955|nr:XrtN system VIT domain-containing protein [Pontibacter sp. G13]WNJ16724.1 XrtN system VIT domain-containing protein [Pontibacter sp. G13]
MKSSSQDPDLARRKRNRNVVIGGIIFLIPLVSSVFFTFGFSSGLFQATGIILLICCFLVGSYLLPEHRFIRSQMKMAEDSNQEDGSQGAVSGDHSKSDALPAKVRKPISRARLKSLHQLLFVLMGLALSGYTLFIFSGSITSSNENAMMLFLGTYILAVLGLSFTLGNRVYQKDWWHLPIQARLPHSILLIIFSVAAHALNHTEIQVFVPYAGWMWAYLGAFHISWLFFPFYEKLPEFGRVVLAFVYGAGVLMSLYMTIFLLPLMAISIPLMLGLGLSALSFTPLFWLLHMAAGYHRIQGERDPKRAYWLGLTIPAVVISIFLWKWGGIQQDLEQGKDRYAALAQPAYPEWVYLSQAYPKTDLAEAVMMSEATRQRSFYEEGFDGMTRQYEEFVRHNPLPIIGRLLNGPFAVDRETRVKVLESKFDARHMTHRRLWTGRDLETTHVDSEIELFPDYRLAYVQQTIQVANQPLIGQEHHWSGRTQEAVYTFYLPDGAVATSLSLWVEGVERKSRLTTRGKADSAYTEIVGVERRDPALMHWQEGNRVTVTIFPVERNDSRQFKVGFTMPFHVHGDRMTLHSLAFDGPDFSDTEATISVRLGEGQQVQDFDLPAGFKEQAGRWTYEGPWQPNLTVEMDKTPLGTGTFSFLDETYSLQEIEYQPRTAEIEEVWLDIHAGWTYEEMRKIMEQIPWEAIWVYTDSAVKVTEENHDALFAQLHKQAFSLLPFDQIHDPAHALVISKSQPGTPLLMDLDGSQFAHRSIQTFTSDSFVPIMWWDLSDTPSDYVKSLRELRLIDWYGGAPEALSAQLSSNTFPTAPESTTTMNLPFAQLQLVRTPGTQPNTAPDHLARLFVYQDLMREIGRQYFDRAALEENWVRKAELGFVLSPISSLIVLETDQDYDRFGIEENEETLGNAQVNPPTSLGGGSVLSSHNEDGAVPEPHEWALILLVLMAGGYFWRMKARNPQQIA